MSYDKRSTGRIGVGLLMEAFERLGFAFREQEPNDFGIDAHAELMTSSEATGQLLAIQLKSGASSFDEVSRECFVFRCEARHAEYWTGHSLPVVICLCDIENRRVFWQVANRDTAVSTGKQFKFLVPQAQELNEASVHKLKSLLTPMVAADRFTIFRTEDVSHGMAKRYSVDVVVNGTLSKAEVASVVRQVTQDSAKLRYTRSHIVEQRWGDSDAHVVTAFVYLSAEDRARRNHTCRSQWIHPDLPADFRPMAFSGENVGNEIIVEWNGNYALVSSVYSKPQSKHQYVALAIDVIETLSPVLERLSCGMDEVHRASQGEADFISASSREFELICQIDEKLHSAELAPFECAEVDQKLANFMASMSTIQLVFSEKGLQTWEAKNRLFLARRSRDDANQQLQHLRYELSKIR